MHRHDGDAFETGIPPEIGLRQPIVVRAGRADGVVAVDDPSDALAGGWKEDSIIEPYLIHELDPAIRAGILKAAFRIGRKRAWRSTRQRILDMTIERKHAAPESGTRRAIGKMTSDGIAVFENMAVAIDDF